MNRKINLGDFGTFAHVNPDKAQALKVLEEASEVVEAYKAYHKRSMESPFSQEKTIGEYRYELLDECADVCQAVANLVVALTPWDNEWDKAVKRCHDRNEIRGRY
mgnify:CR=1 FL=1